MKVIFLDIDGVLIPIPSQEKLKGDYMEAAIRSLSKDAVNLLWELIINNDAKIVISSSWRHSWNSETPWCRQLLEACKRPPFDYENLSHYVIWITPSKTNWGRATEILLYIDRHNRNCKPWDHISHWVAIDDEQFDMKAIKRIGKLVKTEMKIWFSQDDMELANSILQWNEHLPE